MSDHSTLPEPGQDLAFYYMKTKNWLTVPLKDKPGPKDNPEEFEYKAKGKVPDLIGWDGDNLTHEMWDDMMTDNLFQFGRKIEFGTKNVGIPTQVNNLFVLDFDVATPEELENGALDSFQIKKAIEEYWLEVEGSPLKTYTVETSTGGIHLYFKVDYANAKVPTKQKNGEIKPEFPSYLTSTDHVGKFPLDIRGTANGQVVAAGSKRVCTSKPWGFGKYYTCLLDVDPIPLPEWLGQYISNLKKYKKFFVDIETKAKAEKRRAEVPQNILRPPVLKDLVELPPGRLPPILLPTQTQLPKKEFPPDPPERGLEKMKYACMECVPASEAETYDPWYRYAIAFKRFAAQHPEYEPKCFEAFDEFSQRAPNYTQEGVEREWAKTLGDKQDGINDPVGWMINKAKEFDEKKFFAKFQVSKNYVKGVSPEVWKKIKVDFYRDQLGHSDIIVALLKDDIKICGDAVYGWSESDKLYFKGTESSLSRLVMVTLEEVGNKIRNSLLRFVQKQRQAGKATPELEKEWDIKEVQISAITKKARSLGWAVSVLKICSAPGINGLRDDSFFFSLNNTPKNQYLIPIPGGLCYDAQNDCVIPRTKAHAFTQEFPITPDFNEDTTEAINCKRVVSQWMCDKPALTEFLWRSMGSFCTGKLASRTFFTFHGPAGSNGKSKMAKIMKICMGPWMKPLPGDAILKDAKGHYKDQKRVEIQMLNLQHCRLAWKSEAANDARFFEENIKNLTGDDPFTGRFNYSNETTEFYPMFKCLLLCNACPSWDPGDPACTERIMNGRLPWIAKFYPEDQLPEELKEGEYPADPDFLDNFPYATFFGLVLKAANRFINGGNPTPAELKEERKEFVYDNDVIGLFLRQNLTQTNTTTDQLKISDIKGRMYPGCGFNQRQLGNYIKTREPYCISVKRTRVCEVLIGWAFLSQDPPEIFQNLTTRNNIPAPSGLKL